LTLGGGRSNIRDGPRLPRESDRLLPFAKIITRFSALAPNVRGSLWILASAFAFSLMNAIIKHLGSELHAFEIAFFRALLGIILIAPFALRWGLAGLKTSRPILHLFRSLMSICAMLTYFYALANMPLAAAVGIAFSKPLFTVVFAVLFLDEKVGWRRWLATLFGFAGVLVMLNPTGGELGLPAISNLVSSLVMGIVMILVKKMTDTEQASTMLFYFSLAAAMGSGIAMVPFWVTPGPDLYLVLLALGIVGTLGQYFLTRAYRAGDASAITPMDYFQLLFAAMLGLAFFGEIPDIRTAIGGLMIVASNLYIMHRNAKLQRPATNDLPLG
jgi:drug/metabolite transporter (DMT)-like permease